MIQPEPAWRRGRQPLSLIAMLFGMACLIASTACARTIPAKYLKQAEPGVNLTALVNQPKAYAGKVVILGGVIVEERRADRQVWLHLKNRPLDADYQPHRDATGIETESGHYWVVLSDAGLPQSYNEWARLTVVGKVLQSAEDRAPTAESRAPEPVLGAIYLRGWGYGLEQHAWEASQDPNYMSTSPLVIQPIQAR